MENYRRMFLKYLDNNLEGDELKVLLLWMKNPENSKQWEDWIKEDWELYGSIHDKFDNINDPFDNLKSKIEDNS